LVLQAIENQGKLCWKEFDLNAVAPQHSNDCPWLRPMLACPLCKGALGESDDFIFCRDCAAQFPQSDKRCIDLLPGDSADPLTDVWRKRQTEMERWYTRLIATPARASTCFEKDYSPFPPGIFEHCEVVLDIGCGTGVLRNYLPASSRYVGLDPSVTWRESHWESLRGDFPCLAEPFPFTRGVGEHLPFASARFDRVFAFWSLNHARRPEQVIQEVGRVLRPEGRFFIVLEDMRPTLRDFPARFRFALSSLHSAKAMAMGVLHLILTGAWTLQADHIRITEADIRNWSRDIFKVEERAWYGDYLSYELVKL
jgi:SAM-dependent methyltransferase